MASDKRAGEDRPSWAQAMAPAAMPRKVPATEVKHGHSAAYDGKYAPKRGR